MILYITPKQVDRQNDSHNRLIWVDRQNPSKWNQLSGMQTTNVGKPENLSLGKGRSGRVKATEPSFACKKHLKLQSQWKTLDDSTTEIKVCDRCVESRLKLLIEFETVAAVKGDRPNLFKGYYHVFSLPRSLEL